MTNDELKNKLANQFPTVSFEEGTEWLTINIDSASWKTFAQTLRNDEQLQFDYLFCMTCVDWMKHLAMVYHLSSTTHRNTIVVKANLNREKPEIETVSNIWRTAEMHEREVYEMFGVNFINHPDLRLLILPEGWEGKNPMRKDFEDAVNMIKL